MYNVKFAIILQATIQSKLIYRYHITLIFTCKSIKCDYVHVFVDIFILCLQDIAIIILVHVEGKKLPTELKAEASQLRKKMKFDDREREGTCTVFSPMEAIGKIGANFIMVKNKRCA